MNVFITGIAKSDVDWEELEGGLGDAHENIFWTCVIRDVPGDVGNLDIARGKI